MIRRIGRLFLQPLPARLLLLRVLDSLIGFLPYETKLSLESIARPNYGYCLLQAARLAKKLGHGSISAIEFGVAGGNGLVALEMHAEHVARCTGVDVAIYGFDTGTGMPPPADFRDLPYLWQSGHFAMEVERLRARLRKAKLVLGPVEETVRSFWEQEDPPPIGFIALDLDYYSSTRNALSILESAHRYLLPRIACYVDDIVGDIDCAFNEYTGELLAIREFNESQDHIKLAQVRGLRFFDGRIPRQWHEQVFVAHLFTHPDYSRPVSDLAQLPLLHG
jgi:hypothetical protein